MKLLNKNNKKAVKKIQKTTQKTKSTTKLISKSSGKLGAKTTLKSTVNSKLNSKVKPVAAKKTNQLKTAVGKSAVKFKSKNIKPKTPKKIDSKVDNKVENIVKKSSKLENQNSSKSALGRGLGALLSKPVSVFNNSNSFKNQAFLSFVSNSKQADNQSQSLPEQSDNTNLIDFEKQIPNITAQQTNTSDVIAPNQIFAGNVVLDNVYDDLDVNAEQENNSSEDSEISDGSLQYLKLSSIEANPKQPRQYFSEDELHSLAESIKESGLLQPILVRTVEGSGVELNHFEIIAGERRFRAAKLAGLEAVPAIVRNLDDRETLELSIVENVQRSDLNPIEEARAYQRLISEFGQTQNEIATALSKDRTVISNSLRLLKLCEAAQNLLIQKKISAGHGKALLMIEDLVLQKTVAEQIISDGLSVRQVEQIAGGKEIEPKKSRVKKTTVGGVGLQEKSFALIELEDRLRRALGTKVNLQIQPSGEGEIRVSFFSKDELQRILEIIERR
jgi:ParB family chromosome partitioning protein